MRSSLVLCSILLVACSEAGSGNTGPGSTASSTSGEGATTTASTSTTSTSNSTSTSTSTTASTSAVSSTTGSSSSSGAGGSGGAASGAVINEISSAGADWVELANATGTAIDLSGMILCDQDSTTMMCDETNAVIFPSGASLPAHGYVLVVGKEDADAGVGPHDMCLSMGGPTSCYYATWGISNKKGDAVYLHDANDKPLDMAAYPMNATMNGQTWCRLPDVTGAFAVCTPTPGGPNQM